MSTKSICILTGADHESAEDCSTHRHRIESTSPTGDTTPASDEEWHVLFDRDNPQFQPGLTVIRMEDMTVVTSASTPEYAAQIVREHNAHRKLVEALKLFVAMDKCNYELETMRRSGLFEQISEALALAEAQQ